MRPLDAGEDPTHRLDEALPATGAVWPASGVRNLLLSWYTCGERSKTAFGTAPLPYPTRDADRRPLHNVCVA